MSIDPGYALLQRGASRSNKSVMGDTNEYRASLKWMASERHRSQMRLSQARRDEPSQTFTHVNVVVVVNVGP
ncbi:hypothetical protein WMF27_43415 [Sorangium sp. So ce281]|uniref:hypothetical protein n=1 Tax=unclassified Sorangium TaxID=2621164 RepID=UPI003F5D8BBC